MNETNNDIQDSVIQDDKGRDVIVINQEGRIAFARFPDIDEETKDYMIRVCKELTDDDPNALRNFLNYKDVDNEFCV